MSVLPDYAAPARLAAIGDALVGQKLRLVGRMMCYDSTTGFISLWDKEDALLVDVTLCLDPSANVWLQDNFCSIQVIGHLEKCSRELTAPELPPHLVKPPQLDTRFVLRAIRVIPAFDAEQSAWNKLAEQVRMHTDSELKSSK
ncbi:hypothetical protein DFJ43DRAFT_1067274 [Lentinula guzmanii]|uniref:Uncharacterized protein n=1 Tax=Lentinula guzmanii TaxID=2804957 RepID=A0AA38JV41_9AGAR|nr:hypothetical protein DFJ43DRAFT_1067274 [Lentinula guzmanii]